MNYQTQLQKAVLARLNADSTLSSLVSAILDMPREGQAFPYVSIVEGTVTGYDFKDTDGYTITMGFNTFTQNRGTIQAKDIQWRIRELLHHAQFDVGDKSALSEQSISLPAVVSQDGKTVSMVSRYTFRIA